MPKPVYQIFLGAFLLAFVAVACDNKKSDKTKEVIKDTISIDSVKNVEDSIINKPVDPGTVPKPPGD